MGARAGPEPTGGSYSGGTSPALGASRRMRPGVDGLPPDTGGQRRGRRCHHVRHRGNCLGATAHRHGPWPRWCRTFATGYLPGLVRKLSPEKRLHTVHLLASSSLTSHEDYVAVSSIRAAQSPAPTQATPRKEDMSQTVRRAIEIMEHISEVPRNPTEVGTLLGVHRATALRLLDTLADGGLARRLPDGRYAVGHRLAGLAEKALEQFDLRSIAAAHTHKLGARCGHTVHLATVESGHIVYADKVEPAGSVRLYSQIGKPVTLHTAGVAKAILAFLPADRVDALLSGCDFARHTSTTITSRAHLNQALERVREQGWASDDGELEDYVNCVATPVWAASGNVVASVSVTSLKAKADLTTLQSNVLPDLLSTARLISEELGWRP